jgi:hypothetical protein
VRYVFRDDLRRAVIFARNDLVKDAPISRVDSPVRRNMLMYLNAETARNVLGRLHFALAPQGTPHRLSCTMCAYQQQYVHRCCAAGVSDQPRSVECGL